MASANPANQSPGGAEAEIAVKRRFIGEKKKLKRETQHRKKFREKISGINDDVYGPVCDILVDRLYRKLQVSGFFFLLQFPPKTLLWFYWQHLVIDLMLHWIYIRSYEDVVRCFIQSESATDAQSLVMRHRLQRIVKRG